MKLAAIVFRLRVVVSAMHATFTTELQNYIGDSLTSALRSSQAGFIRASPALRERLLPPVSRSGGGCGGGHPSAGTSRGRRSSRLHFRRALGAPLGDPAPGPPSAAPNLLSARGARPVQDPVRSVTLRGGVRSVVFGVARASPPPRCVDTIGSVPAYARARPDGARRLSGLLTHRLSLDG